MSAASNDGEAAAMRRALEIARRGEGSVEPNPMVGCVIVRGGEIVAEGWHERHGGPHAEVQALRAAGESARGATLVVTLEPCCHTGKTPPCTDAIRAAGVSRVVAATRDPFPAVDGGGIRTLTEAGVDCVVGVEEAAALELLAPFRKRTLTGSPWVIAKWAMTLDGRIASATGDSMWITDEAARARVHELRGRVDAVLVGAGTLVADDPLLTARPSGPRDQVRVVIACDRPLPAQRQLWDSTDQGPVLVGVGAGYPRGARDDLANQGVEVIEASSRQLLAELGSRGATNVLVEGGSKLLGSLFDDGLIDEAWAFVAPKLIGGAAAPGPIGAEGRRLMKHAALLSGVDVERIGDDTLVRGRIIRPSSD